MNLGNLRNGTLTKYREHPDYPGFVKEKRTVTAKEEKHLGKPSGPNMGE